MPKTIASLHGYCQGILTFCVVATTALFPPILTPKLYAAYDQKGLSRVWPGITLSGMQLIQIGEVRQKTILDLVMEMAARQFAEIEQLKTAARTGARRTRSRRAGPRCDSSQRSELTADLLAEDALIRRRSSSLSRVLRQISDETSVENLFRGPETHVSANAVASQGGDFMSFRNGDKSRENRIRKARQKMREKVRELQATKDSKAPAAVAGKK